MIQKALSADHEVSVASTSRRGHATRLAQGASHDGTEAVCVLGGDGTLNEAANGLAGSTVALGVVPGGSTNVFARTLGYVNDPIEATEQLIAAMARGTRRRIGLGSANGRYFLFHVGIGFDAAVVEQVERRAGVKRWMGHPLFVFAAFDTWFRHYDRSRVRFAVHYDAAPPVDAYFAICLNTNPYTYLGNRPLSVAPEAGFDTGLAMVTFRSLRFAVVLGAAGSALLSGRRLRRSRAIDRRVELVACDVVGHGPVPYQVDGDYLGTIERLEFRHHPDALDVYIP